ncbi:MAG TPA: DUF2786 domain-containing protein [Ktedonobacteraceae bacterium]|nr:DUF2786 domain-containing protein [Ktedonobacteraceae bacterium]
MLDTITPVLAKIKKLLALSTSSNPNEAAAAAAKAQELLMQHNLTLSQVETEVQASSYKQDFVGTGSRVWKRLLLAVIARNNFCEAIYDSQKSHVIVIGEAHNQEVVTYLYAYLIAQLEPMAVAAYNQSSRTVHAKSWLDSFYIGAVESVSDRLEAHKQEMVAASNECRSLVVVKDAELQDAVQKLYPHTRKGSAKRIRSSTGYDEGLEAGKRVPLNKAVASSQV